MKCSDKEWQHCQKEKRGCEGCFYSDEISIGDYVRTDKGKIAQIKEIRLGKHKSLDEFINMYMFDNENWTADKYIVKHSKDIIDLLQIGDIITTNNLCAEITKIDGDTIYLANYMGTCNIEDIESIITKEQIKQIEFRIKE